MEESVKPAVSEQDPQAASLPAAAEATAAATTKDDTGGQLDGFRHDIAKTIRDTFPWLFRLTVFVALALIGLVWLGFAFSRTMDATVLAASVQVAFGMVIGFVCVYLGLMMTWFGIDAAFTLKGSGGAAGAKMEGALQSASPGLLFALAGIILIGACVHKEIKFEEHGYKRVGSTGVSSGSDDEEVVPEPPAGGFKVTPDSP